VDFFVIVEQVFPLLLRGFAVTLETTVVSLAIAMALGLCVCLMSISRVVVARLLARAYIGVVRGTPIMVQCFFIYFGIPQLLQSMGFDVRLTPLAAGIITLSLNAGAYIAEIFRGGIQAIDVGQMEAARSLGLSYGQAMCRVIIPQAARISIPALVNQFIISLKDTSIISVISLAEIVYEAKIYIGRTMESFVTWTIVGVFYLVVVLALGNVSLRIEKRLKRQ
jgi:His/Glu/Gln/Arg/opine family amino acid ABC transporter permease subunit